MNVSALSTFASYLAVLPYCALDRPQNLSMTLLCVNKTEKWRSLEHVDHKQI